MTCTWELVKLGKRDVRLPVATDVQVQSGIGPSQPVGRPRAFPERIGTGFPSRVRKVEACPRILRQYETLRRSHPRFCSSSRRLGSPNRKPKSSHILRTSTFRTFQSSAYINYNQATVIPVRLGYKVQPCLATWPARGATPRSHGTTPSLSTPRCGLETLRCWPRSCRWVLCIKGVGVVYSGCGWTVDCGRSAGSRCVAVARRPHEAGKGDTLHGTWHVARGMFGMCVTEVHGRGAQL